VIPCCFADQQPPEPKGWKNWRSKSKSVKQTPTDHFETTVPLKTPSPHVPRIRLEALSNSGNQSTSRAGFESPRLTPKQSLGRFLGRVLPGKQTKLSRKRESPDVSARSWPHLEGDASIAASFEHVTQDILASQPEQSDSSTLFSTENDDLQDKLELNPVPSRVEGPPKRLKGSSDGTFQPCIKSWYMHTVYASCSYWAKTMRKVFVAVYLLCPLDLSSSALILP
jgi:hypothetical protein